MVVINQFAVDATYRNFCLFLYYLVLMLMVLLTRKIRPQQFDIFVEKLETHLQSKSNDMNLKELIECLVMATEKFSPKIRQSRKQYQPAKKFWISHYILKSIKHQ